MLAKYVKKNRGQNPPAIYRVKKVNLGAWLQACRVKYRNKALPDDQITQLEDAGIVWSLSTEKFAKRCQLLKKYTASHEGKNPVYNYEVERIKLGEWVSRCRLRYGKNTLSAGEIKQLEDAGIIWSVYDYLFTKKCKLLKKYTATHGGKNPPRECEIEGVELGAWVGKYRMSYEAEMLSAEQIAQLEGAGIVWSIPEAHFAERCELLREYMATHPGKNPPRKYEVNGIKLGEWVKNMRHRCDDEEQIAQLEDAGIIW